ncbi:DUF5686 and carboxypeptidase regulatory-like domain-containing protein [Pedobacter chitinilyticus]|uniref:Carboxypeptidase-like regulatory domain-containing protein n=1 Tax=Pedobacter chitinilyticus TaxID=2233776 RepID=A0A443YWC5_9SPHI|nr:DUF5686 and carboxypeptidase regulatory-like domain-containing protein [Pedobacter chitinilyticus]RWU08292.1 carboxypeptidase-like regulatory domain-containing protein [Pedobacter chitinilyticus]
MNLNKKLLLLISFVTLSLGALAQQFEVKGKITDSDGQPIPFVSVFIKGTTKGVSANAEGAYSINVDRGLVTLTFTIVGFKPATQSIDVFSNTTLNQTLQTEQFTLNSVVIKANGEDPAYRIVRNAIKNRKAYLEEVFAYSSDVYIKGMQKLVGAPKKFFGRDIQKTLNLDTNRNGILYLSESQSKFSYMKPDRIKEEMISSKISGRNNAFSFNKASDMRINFYENLLLENSGLSARSFVSPIADNAMFYYKYKLLGKTEENGLTINKIEVSPRRKNDPVFRGIIYIADDTWRLMGTDLNLTKDAGVNLIDTLNIAQHFIKIDKYYMPSNLRFQFNGNVFGFKFQGYFISFYSNYNINPKFEKGYFTPEILKITKAVNKKDSAYWANNRPIPLTEEERKDYIKKDSIALRMQSKTYLDSVEKANNNFTLGKILVTSYQHNDRYHKRYYTFDPLLQSVFYNTVEGFAIKYGVTYRKQYENNKYLFIRPQARYGFANKRFTANVNAYYYYDPTKRASISLGFGNEIADLNNYGSMSLLSNTLNTLLFERNYPKFYKRDFVTIGTQRELANGLQASLSVDYSNNHALTNSTLYKIRDYKDREFTSNNPLKPNDDAPFFADYKSTSVTATLTYTIGQKYITRPDAKIYTEAKYPRLSLRYKKGLDGIFGGETDYDLIIFEAYQERIGLGLFGYTSFVVGAGKFLNSNKLFYPEFKHFRGNNAMFFPPNLRKFRFLDFYQYSTNQHYFEAHLEHNFSGFILNKIPLLRKLKLEEVVGINYLTQPEKKNYTEYYFGIQRLVFGISYGFAFDNGKRTDQGFRFSYNF